MENGTIIGYPESSAITSWIYNADKLLSLTYTGGKMYHYKNVPFTVVTQMLTADSVGKFLNTVIKPNYEFIA